MLHSISIRNIVLIESLTVPFATGLCVLTGETGAGKSILLDSIGLALGRRAEARLVRSGADQGSVLATFLISNNADIEELLRDQAIELEDELTLRRVIYNSGKSKAFVNGTPVSLGVLQKLGELLIEIHGQHDTRGLFNPVEHRRLVDAFGRHEKLTKKTSHHYKAWRAAAEEYDIVKARVDKAREDEDYLRHVLAELTKLGPEEGEEEELANARTSMMQSEKIIETLKAAISALTGKNDVMNSIRNAERALDRSTAQVDDLFEPAMQALDRAGIEVVEAISAIESLSHEVQLDTQSLEETEERLFSLRDFARKYQCSADELPAYMENVARQLNELETQDECMTQLQEKMDAERRAFIEAAGILTKSRQKTAEKLAKSVQRELEPLKMGGSRFKVEVLPLKEAQWNGSGQDDVRFVVSTNPGSPFGALDKIASGGELSRFMLSLKVVLSGVNTIPTLVFDEIDTGIGGAVADAVGRRLSGLGEGVQVMCVTHQPQVASYGNHHLKIAKQVADGVTTTQVKTLEGAGRKEEIARMLAGEIITDEARAAATKLMEMG